MEKVIGRAYSSSANLGPGFDVVAISLDAFYDEVEAWLVNDKGAKLMESPAGINPRKNTAISVAKYMLDSAGHEKGVSLRIIKGVPIGMGLGSSGATAAATAIAVNHLLGSPFSMDELIDFAARAEGIVAGTPHADNVAASLLGGFVVITSVKPFKAVRLSKPKKFKFIIAMPDVDKVRGKTKMARKVLPKSLPFEKYVFQSASLARLIAGFILEDEKMVGEAMSSDKVVERAREPLIPGYKEVRKAALDAGALGVCVSGAGPSMLILYRNHPHKIEEAVANAYRELGIDVELKRAKIGPAAKVFKR